jgi:colanic acid biosynthesis glycosyl transferase WcaI
LLQDLPDVQFVLVGDGTDLPAIREAARERQLPNIRFLGRHPESSMSRFLSIADVLLVHLRDDPLFRITVPHKIYTYLAVGKPILAAIDGDAAATVEAARAGLTCPAGDPRLLADTVRKFRTMSPSERETMGRNGRQVACTQYRRELLVGQISAVLEGVLASVKERKPSRVH